MAVQIHISEDRMAASVASIGPRTTVEEVVEALNASGVKEGIHSSTIIGAIDAAKTSGKPSTDVVVAEGDPISLKTPPRLEMVAAERLPSLKTLVAVLACERPEDMKAIKDAAPVFPVAANAVLGRKVVGEFKPGRDVLGQELNKVTLESLPPQFTPGDGVTLSGTGEYRADHAGYAGVVDGRLTVVSPIWVAPDAALAAFLCLPLADGAGTFTEADARDAVAASGVRHGVDDVRLAAAVERLSLGEGRALLPIARAEAPREPVDGSARFAFRHTSAAGAERKDGSIDLKERQGIPTVAEDELLVACTPPEEGAAGTNVRGETIAPRLPTRVEIAPGENVRVETDAGTVKVFATINGGATVHAVDTDTETGPLTTYAISVLPIAQIPGDVGYDTGNVNFKGNVEVKGVVQSGFRVEATGDIVVSESLENGAFLKAGGNVTVTQGILGEKTVVEAGGTVRAKFIQEAKVTAGEDVEAESYIRAARVQAAGSVRVAGKGTAGGIMGGETWAVRSVTANNVGAEGTMTTLVALGVLADTFETYAEKRESARKWRSTREALMSAIGTTTLNAQDLKGIIKRNPRRRDEILRYVEKANEAAREEQAATDEMRSLDAQVGNAAGKAHLDVPNVAHHKVRVRIGYEETVLTADLKGTRFRLDTRDGKRQVGWLSLSDVKTDGE